MVLLLFVDGVGVGPRGPQNPLDGCGSPYFSQVEGEPLVPRGGVGVLTDATLGVEGLPQSATGQATIITGRNAPAFLGHHQSAFPGGRLRPLLREHSLFARLASRGLRVAHANVATAKVARRRSRLVSAMAIAAEEAGLEPRGVEDIVAGRALHHDFTNRQLIAYGYDQLRPLEPHEAARHLARLAADHDFCVFEYFLTDMAGHDRDFDLCRAHIRRLDVLVEAVLAETDLERSTVVLTSDHGNLEDLSTKSHTRNPVSTLAWGAGAAEVAARVAALTDIAPAIEALL